ncbi:MAG: DUF421 domain-containing protein [Oscillospiraceae bacterium]|nr:DUF421 domain-containing protein [Oscillospiraceae bacterium]
MLNITLRTIVVYVFIVAAVRLSGKRQLGELQPSELVTTILISNLASLPVEETNLALLPSLLPIVIIVSLEILLSYAEIRSGRFSSLISGNKKTVVANGTIDQRALFELRYGIDDLLEALRAKDIFDINEVSYAVVETNGALSVCKKQGKQTVVNESFLDPPAADRPTMSLIVDGEVQRQALELCGVNEAWLDRRLGERSIERQEVLLFQYAADETITVLRRQVR